MKNNFIETNQKEFQKAVLIGDRRVCSKITQDLIETKTPITVVYEEILKQTLYNIGKLWETNRISVATEHMASAIIEAILNENYSRIVPPEKHQKKILTCCVENEFHQIGIKMVNDIFELNGWNTFFLGSNTPLNELISFAKEIKPDILAISISLYFNFPIFKKSIELFNVEIKNTTILVGGQAFTRGGNDILSNFKNIIYLKDLNSIENYITTH